MFYCKNRVTYNNSVCSKMNQNVSNSPHFLLIFQYLQNCGIKVL